MNSRYTRVFTLTNNLYQKGSPIIVSAGALLKDNKENKIVAQLKIKNISDDKIKAAKVIIHTFDTIGNAVDSDTTYEYLDLAVPRDGEFGQQIAVAIEDNTTRAFTLEIVSVAFVNNSVWKSKSKKWQTIPEQYPLANHLETSLVEQYIKKTSSKSKNEPSEYEDLWICSCGVVNHENEHICHECQCSKDSILNTSLEELREMREKQRKDEEEERKKAEEKTEICRKDGIYASGIEKMTSESISGYESAIRIFQTISGWKDSDEQISACRKKMDELKANQKAKSKKLKKIFTIVTAFVCVCISIVVLLVAVIIPRQKLSKAINLLESHNYDSAYALLEETGKNEAIKSSKYDLAVKFIDLGDYESAYILLKGLSYKDSGEKINNLLSIKPNLKYQLASEGEILTFGKYEQDNNLSNGKEDIEWLVIAKESDRLLVVSDKALDYQQFHPSSGDMTITWESCSLRKWLNSTFFTAAFSTEEQAQIQNTIVSADKSPECNRDPGNVTTDKVFLLSITESEKYFKSDEDRKCIPTDYAVAQGAPTFSDQTKDNKETCWWWLRTSGGDYYGIYDTALVNSNGSVNYDGSAMDDYNCIRPTLWIGLD